MTRQQGRATLVMALAALALFTVVTAGRVTGQTHPPPAGAAAPFHKGMVFGLFARDDPGHTEKGLAEMKALGVDSVSLVVPWVTRDVRAVKMKPRGDMTPTDASLERAIRRSHEMGMRVFLMPFLYVSRLEGDEWRGKLTPTDPQAWWRNYGDFILHYATLAEREKVEYFSVGSELCSTESRRAEWMDLIARVRAVYHGRITYSANWDYRHELSFAGALDVLGMNAYFRLSDDPVPDEDRMVAAWQDIKTEIETWRRQHGKPIIFTEVGYPSRRRAGQDPWNYTAEEPADAEAQRRCYRAFQRVWSGEPHLAGVYFYLWWGEGGARDPGYTPRGKPAAEVIREWYASKP